MNKITFFTRADDKPEWLYQRNELFCYGFDNVSLDRVDATLASCAGVVRSILKTNMILSFATFETCDDSGNVDGGSESFGTAFSTYNKQGQRPITGEMLYRDVLRFSSYPVVGRVAHHWWRGCLDEGDIIELENVGRGSSMAPQLSEIWRDAENAFNCDVFRSCVIFNHGAPFAVNYADTSHYTDSHAATRWRRRVTGKVATAGNAIFRALEQMYTALENAHYWQSLEIRIAPGEIQSALVEALTVGKAVDQAVKTAHEAGSEGGEENATEPIFRFGIAWAPIIDAWQVAANYADEGLQQLIAAHPTQEEGGDTYISRDNLGPYVDKMSEILKAVSKTANADWYNPKSYPNQLSAAQERRLPDIIELAF